MVHGRQGVIRQVSASAQTSVATSVNVKSPPEVEPTALHVRASMEVNANQPEVANARMAFLVSYVKTSVSISMVESTVRRMSGVQQHPASTEADVS
jgi:hypothetical protein